MLRGGNSWLTRELKLAFLGWSMRSFVLGYMSIIYGIYLSKVGLDPIMIGGVLTVASIVNTIIMALVAFLADRHGKRRIFITLGIVTALAPLILVFTESTFLIIAVSLTGIATVGVGGIFGGGGGPFNIIQEAIVAENVTPEKRNTAFSLNAFLSSISAAFGALLVGLPPIVMENFGVNEIKSFSPIFIITSVFIILMVFAVSLIPERKVQRKAALKKRSEKIITKYSMMQAVDGFGTSLVIGNILAYWFFVRFGAEEAQIGLLFFGANMLAAISFLVAGKIANRIGAVRTIVFTHLPANILLLLIPLMPNFALASIVYLVKSSFDKMDIPIRSSYILGVVGEEERVRASGMAGIARKVPSSFGPATTGYLIQAASFASPFFISTILQSANDIAFYLTFRKIKPPEEIGERRLGSDG